MVGWRQRTMKRTIAALGIAALLVVAAGAAAAVPASGVASDEAQADDHAQANDHAQTDDHAQANEDDAAGGAEDARADDHAQANDRAQAADDRAGGPPVDLPAQVPDHVHRIHELIRSFIGGTLDGSLGEAISAVTPGGDDGQQRPDVANETAGGAGTATIPTDG